MFNVPTKLDDDHNGGTPVTCKPPCTFVVVTGDWPLPSLVVTLTTSENHFTGHTSTVLVHGLRRRLYNLVVQLHTLYCTHVHARTGRDIESIKNE